jgi:hypothetical protein
VARTEAHSAIRCEIDSEELTQCPPPVHVVLDGPIEAFAASASDQLVAGDRHPAIGERLRDGRPFDEARGRVGRVSTALLAIVLQAMRFEGKPISPARSQAELVGNERAVLLGHAKASLVADLRVPLVDVEWLEREVAEADIGQPAAVELDEEREVRKWRSETFGGEGTGCQARHGEAKGYQQLGEQPVELVAEAAPSADDDLVEQRLAVEPDRHAEEAVERLEGNREEVGALQGPQRFDGG